MVKKVILVIEESHGCLGRLKKDILRKGIFLTCLNIGIDCFVPCLCHIMNNEVCCLISCLAEVGQVCARIIKYGKGGLDNFFVAIG